MRPGVLAAWEEGGGLRLKQRKGGVCDLHIFSLSRGLAVSTQRASLQSAANGCLRAPVAFAGSVTALTSVTLYHLVRHIYTPAPPQRGHPTTVNLTAVALQFTTTFT